MQFYGKWACNFMFFHNFYKIDRKRIFLQKYLYKRLLFWYNNGCGKIILPLFDTKQPRNARKTTHSRPYKGVVFL